MENLEKTFQDLKNSSERSRDLKCKFSKMVVSDHDFIVND